MSTSAHLTSRLRQSFAAQPPQSSHVNSAPTDPLTDQEKLTIFDQVLTEIEEQDPINTLNPNQSVGSSLKEAEAANATPEISPVEAGAGLQQVEYEPTAEISPEVESYLTAVKKDKIEAPPEIAIADGSDVTSSNHQPAKKPVIVLPITPEIEKKGKKKNVRWSIRWLVEWSQRLMKMFKGEIIYRQTVPPTN